MSFIKGSLVQHPRFGRGYVRMDDVDSILVRFEHGLEECLPSELINVEGLLDRISSRLGRFFSVQNCPPAPSIMGV